jgi:hypothetical protein
VSTATIPRSSSRTAKMVGRLPLALTPRAPSILIGENATAGMGVFPGKIFSQAAIPRKDVLSQGSIKASFINER